MSQQINKTQKKQCAVPTEELTVETGRTHLGGRALLLCLLFLTGCSAFRPLDGLPVRYMPDEFKGTPRSGKKTINLSLLKRSAASTYQLDSGDVLAVYIEGILGNHKEAPPVYFPKNEKYAPSFGYPVPVRDNGTVSLPMISSIHARGKTVEQLEKEILFAYTKSKKLLNAENPRVVVNLQRPRNYRVLVIRQEAGVIDQASGGQGQFNPGASKRGTGEVVSLPAYKNDVLHALAKTGGLPGLDAENTIYIIRNHNPAISGSNIPKQPYPMNQQLQGNGSHTFQDNVIQQASAEEVVPAGFGHTPIREIHNESPAPTQLGNSYTRNKGNLDYSSIPMAEIQGRISESLPFNSDFPFASGTGMGSDSTIASNQIVKIPIRLGPNDQPMFNNKDVVLQDGDIIFIESRETEVFYTSGLLGGGQYTLPRDYDIDILEAISIAESQNVGGGGGGGPRQGLSGGNSALNQDVTVSASKVIILRKLPNGKQVPIKVDLYQAMRHPDERIHIQPGDFIILQYTKAESIMAFIEQHLIEGALFTIGAAQFQNDGGGGN
jgi:Polysaccharide biosynthesis/export protein